jgi:hypothetical protein
MDVTVRDNQESGSYDALVDGRIAGMIIYQRHGDHVTFRSTVVEPGLRGHGIATTLVRQALDDLAEHHRTLTNYCGFVTDYIAAHPEYVRLLDEHQAAQIRTVKSN